MPRQGVKRGTELGELLTAKKQKPKEKKKPVKRRTAKRRAQAFPYRQLHAFIEAVQQHNSAIYVSVDPGATGAIGFISGVDYVVVDIPMLRVPVTRQRKVPKKKRKRNGNKTYTVHTFRRDPDFAGITQLFAFLTCVRDRTHVVLEKIDPSLGRMGRITYGDVMVNRAYAMWPLYLHAWHFASFVEYRPSVWKKYFGLKHDKNASRTLGLRHFPQAPLARVKDHDRAEALLLALYLKEQHVRKSQ